MTERCARCGWRDIVEYPDLCRECTQDELIEAAGFASCRG